MKRTKIAALLAAFGLVTGVLGASTSAGAYPTGQGLTVTASKYRVTTAGSTINVQAKNVYAGCTVKFSFQNQAVSAVAAKANLSGVTPLVKIATPGKAGTFRLIAKTTSTCNPPTGVESASANIIVSDKHGIISFTVSNFKPGSSVITPEIRARIKYFATLYSKATQADLKGYTMGPTVLAVDARLSLNRAKNSFAVLKSWNRKVQLSSIANIQDRLHVGDSARRVEITLRW